MTDGERIVQLCNEPTPTGVNDHFDDINDLMDRMCHVCIFFCKELT